MEYQSKEGTQQINYLRASLKNTQYQKAILIIFLSEMLLVFLAIIEAYGVKTGDLENSYKPGLFNGGIGKFFIAISNGTFSQHTDQINAFSATISLAIVNFILIAIAIFAREYKLIQKLRYVFTIFFGITLTQMVNHATHNYIFMFMTITFFPALYFFWLRYGELSSFIENRIIIFSIRRSIAIFPMFIAISLFTFFALNFVGDPVDLATNRIRFGKAQIQEILLQRWGLEDENHVPIPAWKRYITWIYEFIHGDFGESYEEYPQPVTDNLNNYLMLTLRLQVTALVLAFFFSLVIGILAAYYHRTPADSSISAIALLGLSMPIFVSGILAILIFGGTGLNWFPVANAQSLPHLIAKRGCGNDCLSSPKVLWADKQITDIAWWKTYVGVSWYYFVDTIDHMILPVLTLTFATMATFSRLTRSTMLEIMRQDYILAARANGLSEYAIIRGHALKNVLLPLVTFLGISIGALLVGAPITETIFTYPGLGAHFLAALTTMDVPIIMALTMMITLMILFANLLADIAYTYIDPRITL